MSLVQSERPIDDDPDSSSQGKRKGEKEPAKKDEQRESREVPNPENNVADLEGPTVLVLKMPNKYTKDELLALKESPLAKVRPVYLDVAYDNNNGIWDPELWHYNRKTLEGPMENGNRNPEVDNHRRRSGDPRERLRKEGDGIVLSPQRRSFNSGCYVPNRDLQRANRSHSPTGKNEPPHIISNLLDHREMPSSVPRRIGSGRIIPWDKQEADEFGYRRDSRRDSERDERFDRRSFGRDFETNREKEKGRNGRFERRKEDEPEWFYGGPVSQTDVIELRGFDDADKIGKKKRSAAHKRRSIDRAIAKNTEKQQKSSDEGGSRNDESQSPNPQEGGGSDGRDNSPPLDRGGGGDAPIDSKVEVKSLNEQNSIDFDDILKSDSFTGFITNGVGNSENSRFSRWFNTNEQSPKQKDTSRRSSIQEDNHHFLKNLLNDEPNISIPDDSNQYFAPISPAANTGVILGPNIHPSSNQMNLMEMLHRNKHKSASEMHQHGKNVGKLLSLEELEARMLQRSGAGDVPTMSANIPPKPQQKSEDIESFQRMLAQVANTSHVIPQNGPIPQSQPPMSLLEMLSHSQQQDEAARLQNLMMSAGNNIPSQQDIYYQLAQEQNKIGIQRPSQVEMSRELLSRPEAQAILQGLKRGDLTPQHLYQQLANPAMQPRHRELLLTILKLQGNSGGMGPSPRVLSPVPPHPMFHQQQLRVSPLPNAYCVSPILATSPNTLTVPAMHQRIPSPRELQVHTQNIMQRALIKKKLEEQQENYRKKQEMQQHGHSPARGVSPAKNVSSPTPLAFTPTSVLRKMTADKEDGGKESNKVNEQKVPQGRALTGIKIPSQAAQNQQLLQQWSNSYPQLKQPGRPIVKANNNFQQPPQDQFFQQQRLFNQNQQQQHHRKPPGQQYPSPNPQYQQLSNHLLNQLAQEQLRVKHQQQQQPQVRSPQQNFNQGNVNFQQMLHGQNFNNRNNIPVGRPDSQGGDLSPTSNQLARWFSPELLERARKGKVPNLPNATVALHAMSLEDVERQATPAVHN